jgi:hypothetical protein
MPSTTDPARELSDLIRGLNIDTRFRFDEQLAKNFDTEAWSSEFYQIVFTISTRIDELIDLTDQLPLDEDHKIETKDNLRVIKQAFGPNGLQNTASHALSNYLSPAQVKPLIGLSGLARSVRSYPKLDQDDQDELIEMVDDLIGWLTDHQVSEQDFIRQALLSGLYQLRFRLERMNWLGWGYTLQSLREVISAYFALERGITPDSSNPPAQAMHKFVGDFVKEFLKKAGIAKETLETGDFMLKAYGAVQLLISGKATVAGLLTHISS